MTLDLHPPAAELTRIVAGVTDDQLGHPTPCADTDVATMLAHVAGLAVAFRDAARKIEGPTTQTAPQADRADLPEDWRRVIPRRLAELADAWDPAEAWEGKSTAGGVTLPSAQTGAFANDELVIHAWDLAVSTGQTTEADPANLEACYQLVVNFPTDPEARAGLFGPPVPLPDDAPLLDRALAATGRNPYWTPDAG